MVSVYCSDASICKTFDVFRTNKVYNKTGRPYDKIGDLGGRCIKLDFAKTQIFSRAMVF